MNTTPIALITGANKGLGFETARQLGQKGYQLLVGARDIDRGNTAVAHLKSEGLNAEFLHIDLEQPDSFAALATDLHNRFGHLDVLVNNAGIWLDTWGENTTATISPTDLRRTFDVNFFNLVSLTQHLLPLLKASPAGRIVNMSSILGSLAGHAGPDMDGFKAFAYDSSKTALNQFTVHLAKALQHTPVKVNSAHPGWVQTDMGGEQAPMNVQEGAKTGVWLATLPADGPTGGYFHDGQPLAW
jgi:NAD(P)-dependent dehydrogenase (short-subunit alcohol dehydrogenase family)